MISIIVFPCSIVIADMLNTFIKNYNYLKAKTNNILSITYKNDLIKSCYNPFRLGTVIVLVSSGIDFVNTPRLYSDRATR